jgi:D-3-phosphoglycerate dehydrogenase
MRTTAFLINTARGTIVDEAALINALRTGAIAGAALDVFEKEPPEPDNPLFAMDNVVAMPHVASLTTECTARMATDAARCIHEVLSGSKPTWPVNNPPEPR